MPITMALVAFAVELNPITVAFVVEVSVILLSLPKVRILFPTTVLFKPNTEAEFVFVSASRVALGDLASDGCVPI